MTTKQELATLKEIERIYQNCPERVTTYVRWRWIFTAVGLSLIFSAFTLVSVGGVSPLFCLIIAFLGGSTVGLSFLYSLSAVQIQLLARYTIPRDEDIRKRLRELGDA